MTSNSELANWIEWSLQQPNIIEVKSYICPLIANTRLDNQELDSMDYLNWQYQIGETIPLEKVYVNIIGAAFIGRAQDISFAWDAYQQISGPDFLINDDVGIPWWFSNMLNIECDFANELLWIHCGMFREATYPAQTIVEHLRLGHVQELY
jgi:hypothetical protein